MANPSDRQMTAEAPEPKPEERRVRHPLSLPRGSVRAILALCVAGSAYWLIANPELLRGLPYEGDFPDTLMSSLMLVLGYYFADRARGEPTGPGEPPPLWMPRGTVRWALVFGFAAAVVALAWSLDSFGEVLRLPVLAVVLQVFAFLVGRAAKRIILRFRRKGYKDSIRRFEDIKGVVALASGLGAVIVFCVTDLPISPGVREEVERLFPTIVAFYFGSR